jgi:hypothetical protein
MSLPVYTPVHVKPPEGIEDRLDECRLWYIYSVLIDFIRVQIVIIWTIKDFSQLLISERTQSKVRSPTKITRLLFFPHFPHKT